MPDEPQGEDIIRYKMDWDPFSPPISPRPASSTTLPAVSRQALIGTDAKTNQPIEIGDLQRRSGLYILGRSGTGKTTLIENLIKHDLDQGHGLFFLDPHGDAIENVLRFADLNAIHHKFLLLDPEDSTHSFAINPLACSDVNDWSQRNAAYENARAMFKKIFEKENQPGERPWLEEVIQYAFAVFVENPEYTLAEIPLFLTNLAFREHLLANVRHNRRVVHWWEDYYHPKKAEAAISRLSLLLGHDQVAHIIGQKKTTIDFNKVMEQGQVVLLRLPTTLAPDIKQYVGTIIINELVRAAQRRDRLPAEKRRHFSIYVDEFQNFTYSDDFSTLFTQARKWAIATTVAHQNRAGQFADLPTIKEATAGATSKVFFQTTPADAQENALEYFKLPPEPPLALSEHPVTDLLQSSHTNEVIRRFVRRYLRPLQEKLEDLKEEKEHDMLMRMYFLEEAMIFGIEEDLVGLDARSDRDRRYELIPEQKAHLRSKLGMVQLAHEYTEKAIYHQEAMTRTRLTLRGFNKFLIAVMEGQVARGQEAFSQFLVERVREAAGVPREYLATLILYISIMYGNRSVKRAIPFAFAKEYGFFPDEVAGLIWEAEQETQQKREKFRKEFAVRLVVDWQRFYKDCIKAKVSELPHRQETPYTNKFCYPLGKSMNWAEGDYYEADPYHHYQKIWSPHVICLNYGWYRCFESVRNEVGPYLERAFTEKWKIKFGYRRNVFNAVSLIPQVHDAFYEIIGPERWLREPFRGDVVGELISFLWQFKEGAFVVLALIDCTRGGANFVPDVAGLGKHDVLWTAYRLNQSMQKVGGEHMSEVDLEKAIGGYKPSWISSPGFMEVINGLVSGKRIKKEAHYNEEFRSLVRNKFYVREFNGLNYEARNEVIFLNRIIEERWDWLASKHPKAAHHWKDFSWFTRKFLTFRACALVFYDQVYADEVWPQPSMLGSSDVVAGFVDLIKDTEEMLLRRIEFEREQKHGPEWRKYQEERLATELAKIIVLPPELLDPRVLTPDQIDRLAKACRIALSQIGHVLRVLNDFVEFCELLAEPENRLYVKTKQKYIERRPRDMVDEMQYELLNLPRYMAMAKIIQEKDGEQTVVNEKIRTPIPPKLLREENESIKVAIKKRMIRDGYMVSRREIDRRMYERAEPWRRRTSDRPSPRHVEDVRRQRTPRSRERRRSDEPPPRRS